MKTLQNFQEAGHLIDSCHMAVFTQHTAVRVAVQREPFPSRTIRVSMTIIVADMAVGVAEATYETIEGFLEAWQIDDLEEIFEVLDR